MHEAAREAGKDTMFLIRVPHSSGMLEGKYTAEIVFPPGIIGRTGRAVGCSMASRRSRNCVFWRIPIALLARRRCNGCLRMIWSPQRLPNIYNEEQLIEFARAPETPPLTQDELETNRRALLRQLRPRGGTAEV